MFDLCEIINELLLNSWNNLENQGCFTDYIIKSSN